MSTDRTLRVIDYYPGYSDGFCPSCAIGRRLGDTESAVARIYRVHSLAGGTTIPPIDCHRVDVTPVIAGFTCVDISDVQGRGLG